MIPNRKELVWSRSNIESVQIPLVRRYHGAVYFNNNMYIFGGFGGDQKPHNDFCRLHLGEMKWSVVESYGEIPSPRWGHVSFVYKNKLYIHGGNEAKYAALGDFYSYDFSSGQWFKIDLPNSPTPRFAHSSAVHGNKLYIFGGSKTNKIYFNDLHVFDLDTRTWSLIDIVEPLPKPRAGQIVFVISNKLYLYGGYGDDGGYTYLEDMYYLELENPQKKWIPLLLQEGSENPKTGRQLSCILVDEKCFVFGGYNGKVPQGTLHCFEPNVNMWSVIKLALSFPDDIKTVPLESSKWCDPIPRYGHSTIVDDKKNIIIFGGTGSLFLNDVFIIDAENYI